MSDYAVLTTTDDEVAAMRYVRRRREDAAFVGSGWCYDVVDVRMNALDGGPRIRTRHRFAVIQYSGPPGSWKAGNGSGTSAA